MRTFRSRPADIGNERASVVRERMGRELRLARLSIGLTQSAVARRAGVCQSEVSKAERGEIVSIESLCRISAAVGHELGVRLYPTASVSLRDRGQLSMAQVIVEAAAPPWGAGLEVPIGPGDLRAVDLVLRHPAEIVMVEIVRSIVDLQAQARSGQVKRAALAVTIGGDVPIRLVIAVPDSTRVRRELRSLGPLLAATFPVASAAIWHALRAGEPTGGDGIMFVRERELRAGQRKSNTDGVGPIAPAVVHPRAGKPSRASRPL